VRVFALLALGASGCLGGVIGSGQAAPAPPPDLADAPDLGEPDLRRAASDLADATDLGGAPPDLAPRIHVLPIEAESGSLSGGFVRTDSAAASGGRFIVAPAGSTSGKAVFKFNAPVAGNYVVWGRVLAPADDANSFHVSIDTDVIDNSAGDGASTIWDLPVSTAWTWVRLTARQAAGGAAVVVNLGAGGHFLYVNLREDDTQLDQLIITNDTTLVPTG